VTGTRHQSCSSTLSTLLQSLTSTADTHPKPKTQNPKPKTQNPKPKTQNPKP
jgi:hypothetical protein